MLYTVKDIALDYDHPGDEIVGTVEADTPEAAILAAIKAISPTYIADTIRLDPDGVAKYILPDFVAEPRHQRPRSS
jgi:hypothetical protein